MASKLRYLPTTYISSARTSLQLRNVQSPFFRQLSSTQPFFQAASDSNENPSKQHEAQKDREKMNVEANEYSKSDTDAGTAAQEEAAFDPNSPNDPEKAKKVAGKGNKVNPLEVSPANQELSKGTAESDQTKQK